jgi:hypothetical protein
MKALFPPQAKSVCCIDADAGLIEFADSNLVRQFARKESALWLASMHVPRARRMARVAMNRPQLFSGFGPWLPAI